ncbi:MAG: MBL fold metallo-hydrolase [Phycisphaeraceae bacterium]|nr:MAG: MBL fold metallo-hydrolase [Phycisphaeraceae bacterium]
MRLTRREFTTLGLLAGAAAAGLGRPRHVLGFFQNEQGAIHQWRQVARDVHVALGNGGNAGLVVSSDEALLIDCKNPGFGAALRREAEAVGSPLSRVVNTHHHADHTGGNPAFTPDVPVVSHDAARRRALSQGNSYASQLRAVVQRFADSDDDQLRRISEEAGAALEKLDIESFAPTETLARERRISVGRLTVELRHPGAAHTDNDIFVFIPERNTLHTGDLLFNGMHAFFDGAAGASTHGWEAAIDQMLEHCDSETVVIPGHGPITGADSLREQRRYLGELRAHVEKLVAEGRTREEVAATPLPGYDGYGLAQLHARTLGFVYDEVSGRRD